MSDSNIIGIDIGASNTRGRTLTGKSVYELPNNIQIIGLTADTKVIDSGTHLENKLDLTIEKDWSTVTEDPLGIKTILGSPLRALVGDIAKRYGLGEASNIYPNALANKMQQPVNWINLLTSVVYMYLTENYKGSDYPSEVEIKDVTLVLALPPGEVQHNREAITEVLKGKYNITLNLLNTTILLDIKTVQLVYESSMAVLGYVIGNKQDLGTVLSIDIGASTTDLILVEKNRANDSTIGTIKQGCNLVSGKAKDKFSGQGYSLTEQRLTTAIHEGRYKMGSEQIDCSNIIQLSKKEAAKELEQSVITYLDNHKLDIRFIDGILITGGGSLKGGYYDEQGNFIETSDSLGNYLLEGLTSRFNSLPEILEYSGNPREANINGIYYILRKLSLSKTKQ